MDAKGAWVRANFTISGETVTLQLPSAAAAAAASAGGTAVRYGWEQWARKMMTLLELVALSVALTCRCCTYQRCRVCPVQRPRRARDRAERDTAQGAARCDRHCGYAVLLERDGAMPGALSLLQQHTSGNKK